METHTHTHTLRCWSRYPPTNTHLIRTRNPVAELFPSETTSIFCGPDSKHVGAFSSGWQIPELPHQTTAGQLILEHWEHGGPIPWEPVTKLWNIHTDSGQTELGPRLCGIQCAGLSLTKQVCVFVEHRGFWIPAGSVKPPNVLYTE